MSVEQVFSETRDEIQAELTEAEAEERHAEAAVAEAARDGEASALARAAILEAIGELGTNSRSAERLRARVRELDKRTANATIRAGNMLQAARQRVAALQDELDEIGELVAPEEQPAEPMPETTH